MRSRAGFGRKPARRSPPRGPSSTASGTPPVVTVVQMPLPGEPTNNLTDGPSGTASIGQAKGQGSPEFMLDQVAPASREIWIPVAPDVPSPPALVADDEPR